MDVRVHAHEAPHGPHKEVHSDKKSCWGQRIPCAQHAKTERLILEAPDMRLVLKQGAIVEQRTMDLIQLVLGEFYVDTARPVRFQSPFARIYCEGQCKALIVRELDGITVKNLSGQWTIERTGESTQYMLASGLQTYVGEVTENGKSQMEFPQSLPWLPTLKEWGALYPGDTKQFRDEVKEFRTVWVGAVESVSHLHEEVVKRELASYWNGIAEQKARAARAAAEDEGLRSLFRKKNYLQP